MVWKIRKFLNCEISKKLKQNGLNGRKFDFTEYHIVG